jgi:cytidylate kinase
MNEHSTPERVSEALMRAFSHWENRRAARGELSWSRPGYHAQGFTIAISREAGARGNLVARAVGEQLGWVVYDNELLQRIAQEMKVRVGLLESVDERHVTWLEEQVEAFASVPYVSESAFFRHLVETVLSLGLHGECVILGRGANFILPARTTLRVRLVASLEDRTSTMAQEFGIGRNEAAKLVRDTDRARAAFIKEHLHQDASDPLHYDLVLNTSRLSVADCTELIVASLRRVQPRMGLPRPSPLAAPAEVASGTV